MKAKLPTILRWRPGQRGCFSIMANLLADNATAKTMASRSSPFLQARWGGVFGRGGFAKVDCVHGNRVAFGDTGANMRDGACAWRARRLVGWPDNRDQWPSFYVAI